MGGFFNAAEALPRCGRQLQRVSAQETFPSAIWRMKRATVRRGIERGCRATERVKFLREAMDDQSDWSDVAAAFGGDGVDVGEELLV